MADKDAKTSKPILPTDDLWAITSYFNPMGYRRRRENYRIFRDHLTVPLATVELAYGPDFELAEQDAEILVQLRGSDVLWQKERLLNVALRALPPTCTKIVWLDCDVLFETVDWGRRASDVLDRFMVIQPFTQVHDLPPDWTPHDVRIMDPESRRSVASLVASGVPAETCLRPIISAHRGRATGFSWGARRDLLTEHGFYDFCIVGGGDSAMACAVFGCFEEAFSRHQMNDVTRRRYMAWAAPYHDAVRGNVGFVENNLFHLYHGELSNRRYLVRDKELGAFNFDPYEDIAVAASGCWRWNTSKPAMHAYVRNYFASRDEDG